jgi:hypothetical protein
MDEGPPPAYEPPVAAPPSEARPPILTAAAILLFSVGILTFTYLLFVPEFSVIQLFEDLGLARAFGFGGVVVTLIVVEIVIMLAAAVEAIGAVRLFAVSRSGRVLAVVGAVGVIAGWVALVVVALTRSLRPDAVAWTAIGLSAGLSAVGLILLLLAADRAFSPRT